MKKAWIWGLAVVLGLVLAAPVMAIDWSATGFTVVGFHITRNNEASVGIPGEPIKKLANYSDAAYLATKQATIGEDWDDLVKQRTRLKLTARASENLYGVLYFEMDSGKWGETCSGRNSMGKWGADQVAVEVKNVYMDFRIPGIETPVWARVGVQPFAIRPLVFLYADGAGITGRASFDVNDGKLSLGAGWGKVREYDDSEDYDADIYYAQLDYKKKGLGFGLYGVLQFVDARGGTDDVNLWWVGVYSDGKVGPFNYNFDFVYDGGKDDERDIDYSGWLVRAVVTYPYEKFNFGLGGLYVSGDDADDTDDYTEFIAPYWSEATGINADSAIVVGGWGSDFAAMGDAGWHNPAVFYARDWLGIWGVRLFAEYKALDWLTLMGQVSYWGDTTEEGDSFGSGDDDDDIGWELAAGAHVQIYKNLKLRTAFGYLIAGDATDQDTESIDDPYVWVTTLTYTF